MGEKYNGLLTHFISRVNMIVSMFTWVRDHGYRYMVQCHGYGYGYGYESCMSRSYWYGSETISMGTGTNFCIWISMGRGT